MHNPYKILVKGRVFYINNCLMFRLYGERSFTYTFAPCGEGMYPPLKHILDIAEARGKKQVIADFYLIVGNTVMQQLSKEGWTYSSSDPTMQYHSHVELIDT